VVDDLLVLASFCRLFDVQAKCFLKVLLSFWHQVIRHTSRLGIRVDLQGNDCSNESLVLTDNHDVAAWAAAKFELILDWNGSNILTSCRNDELLDTTSDLDELADHHSLVTRAEVAIFIYAFSRGLLISKIAHHDMPALHADLTLTFRVGILYLDMDTVHGHPRGPLAELVVDELYNRWSTCLTKPVVVDEDDVEFVEKLDGAVLKWSSTIAE